MEFEKRDLYINLFEIYKGLLTEKQINYFMDHYIFDLSYAEIAENYEVSRNAVFDQLKKVIAILENFEDKLKINTKNNKLIDLVETNDFTKEQIIAIIEE